ncbi:hypothetical protein [Halodesulfovibrio sp.]|jgi:hypothetical protein|uniref:hypothetical protein n=1 Tax=Halodesulfovibrio sp. TaxID=1912772 RepID=UPI0025FD26D5|nr:hypothetical protein [Halodesulfovibrio sp.]MCT4534420.1 hypothetical protein [Halodesulfovibrio sp.]
MLDTLVGTILTDARTVLEDLDPFLLDLEVSAERADSALLSTIYNTTPLLSNCFNLLGLTEAVALVDLLQLVTGAFRKKLLSLSYVNIREVIRAFSALVAFLDSADSEKISIATSALNDLIATTWAADAKNMLATHTLRDPQGKVAFSVAGYVLQDELMQEFSCYVLELDDSGQLAGTQFTPFSLLQFLYKSGQVLGVQFASPESGVYLHVLYATVLTAEQLQMVLDIPEASLHLIPSAAFDSPEPAWQASFIAKRGEEPTVVNDIAEKAYVSEQQVVHRDNSDTLLPNNFHEPTITELYKKEAPLPSQAGTLDTHESEQKAEPEQAQNMQHGVEVVDSSKGTAQLSQSIDSASPVSGSDKFSQLEAELEGELFEEALSAGILARSLDKAQQELPERVESVAEKGASLNVDAEAVVNGGADTASIEQESELPIQTAPVANMYGFDFTRNKNKVVLYVSTINDEVKAEHLRAALLELFSTQVDVELVLCESIRGNLELLQLLLSAAMTAGLRRQKFCVTGEAKDSVASLLTGCGITENVLKAQGIASFLG